MNKVFVIFYAIKSETREAMITLSCQIILVLIS
jgi:hypothetical protein